MPLPISVVSNSLVEAFEFQIPKIGASEGIRTLDTHVGNVMLYQAELRSLPKPDYMSTPQLQSFIFH